MAELTVSTPDNGEQPKDPREMAFRAAMNERIRAMTDGAAEVTETDNAMSRAQSAPPLVV